MKIAVYAFSGYAFFFNRLIAHARVTNPSIEWIAIAPQGHHLQELQAVLLENDLCYLYANFNKIYAGLRPPYELPSGSAVESIFLALFKDKDGYRKLDKDEQLRRAATIYKIYKNFLTQNRPDYLLFPDLEVVDGFILMSLCQELGIQPIYHVGMRILDCSMFSSDCYESLPPYFGPTSSENLKAAETIVDGYEQCKLLPALASDLTLDPVRQPGKIKRVLRAMHFALFTERLHASEDNWQMKVKRNILPLLTVWRRMKFRYCQLRYFDILRITDSLPEHYILYALQYTPESSINGLEPYFVDQSRAIDALLFSMPGHYRLLVKEHPAIAGVRDNIFYRELRKKPGLELVAPDVSTRRLMEKARLIVSITGTIGLEAFLIGRPSFLFGRNFFSHLCIKATYSHEFADRIQKTVDEYKPASRTEKIEALARLLHIGYPFQMADPLGSPNALSSSNVAQALTALLSHIKRLQPQAT